MVLGNPTSDDAYDDDIVMLSDGVICEVSVTTINESLGDNLKNIINIRKGL